MRLRLFLLVAALAVPAAADTISVAGYRERLVAIQGRLRSGDWVGARQRAGRLLADQVAFGGETLEPDRSVLTPIARSTGLKAARAGGPALARLIQALSPAPASPPVAASPEILRKVRAREAPPPLPAGGGLAGPKGAVVLAAVKELLQPVVDVFAEIGERIWNWLARLVPGREGDDPWRERLGLNLPTVTGLVLVAAALLAWFGYRAFRHRQRGGAPALRPAPLSSAADDDPLSRESNEWERYAAELAAAGRAREAVRAWYHAVLVTLFRAGALHHRRGRTNWEYISSLPPGLPWRAGFIELTRHFEREWYGRDRSSEEALAAAEEMARGLLLAVRARFGAQSGGEAA